MVGDVKNELMPLEAPVGVKPEETLLLMSFLVGGVGFHASLSLPAAAEALPRLLIFSSISLMIDLDESLSGVAVRLLAPLAANGLRRVLAAVAGKAVGVRQDDEIAAVDDNIDSFVIVMLVEEARLAALTVACVSIMTSESSSRC